MPQMKKPINEASATELATFALTVLGMERATSTMGKPALLAKIQNAWKEDFILINVKEADIVRQDPPARAGTGSGPFAGRRCATIRIHPNDLPGGDQPVPVSVNGTQIFLPRDEDIRIPYEYMEALDNAKHYVYKQGPNGELLYPPREVHGYPFSKLAVDPPFFGWNMTREEKVDLARKHGGSLKAAKEAVEAAEAAELAMLTPDIEGFGAEAE